MNTTTIHAYGLEIAGVNHAPGAPDPGQTCTCMAWLNEHADRDDRLLRTGSGDLAHLVERATGALISNGALIRAAWLLGYEYERARVGSVDARFRMKIRGVQ